MPSVTSDPTVVSPATEPASIRNGDQAAKNAYSEGVGFEQMLLNQLTQTMTQTIGGSDSSDGLGGTSDDSSQSDGGDSSLGGYSSLMTGALTTAISGNGGTGIAMQIAKDLDPALNDPSSAANGSVASPNGAAGLTTAATGSSPTVA